MSQKRYAGCFEIKNNVHGKEAQVRKGTGFMLHAILILIILLAMLGANPQYRPLIGFSFVLLFAFAALRYNFGNDYIKYLDHFQLIRQTGENPFDIEILFTLLNRISPNFYCMVAFMSLLLVASIWKLVQSCMEPEYIWTSLTVLLVNPCLFLMNLSAMRQAMALVVFLYALRFLRKRRFIPYCVSILIAILFHKTAIILLPVYFFAHRRRISAAGSIGLLLSILLLLLWPKPIIQAIESIISCFDSKNYNHYFTQDLHNSLRATLLTGISFVYILLRLPDLAGNDALYAKLWLLGVVFNLFAYRLAMLTRLEMYFSIFSIVAFPRMVIDSRRCAHKHTPIFNFLCQWMLPGLIITVYLLRYYAFFTNPMWEPFHHYRTILDLLTI